MSLSVQDLQQLTWLWVTGFVAELHHKSPSNLPEKATFAGWLSLTYTGAPVLLPTPYEEVYSIHSHASWPYYAAKKHELSITGAFSWKATFVGGQSLIHIKASVLGSTSCEELWSTHAQVSWPYYAADIQAFSITRGLPVWEISFAPQVQGRDYLDLTLWKICWLRVIGTRASGWLIQRSLPNSEINFGAQAKGRDNLDLLRYN